MRYKINLLLEKKQSMSDKILYFLLHYLRYILVLTQIVVIGVFFYRFKIDQELIDLKDELKQKVEIVSVSEPMMKEAKSADKKMQEIKEITTSQERFLSMLDYVAGSFPSSIYANSMNILKDSVVVEARTNNASNIQTYYHRLQKEKKFKQIALSDINKKGLYFYARFSMTGYTN